MPRYAGKWTATKTTLSATTVTKVHDSDDSISGFFLNDKTSGGDLFYAWGHTAPANTDTMIAVPAGGVVYYDPILLPIMNLYLYSTAGGDAVHVVIK